MDDRTDGSFRLGTLSRSTATIEFAGINDGAATASNIQAAVSDIVDPGINVSVTAVSGTEFTLEFTVAGVGTAFDQPALQVVDNSLSTGQLQFANAGDASGFTSTGPNDLWHVSSGRGNNPGHTPQFSFYFGENETDVGGGAYVNGADGTLRSPEIDLSDPGITGPVTLRLSHLLGVQAGDTATIRVVADEQETVLLSSDQSTAGFEEVQLDLLRFIGKRIQLEFNFQSDTSGTQEGWYVDDVRIELPRVSQSVFLGTGPQQQIVNDVNFGASPLPSVGPDQYGYQAYSQTPYEIYADGFESGVLGPEWTTSSRALRAAFVSVTLWAHLLTPGAFTWRWTWIPMVLTT